MAFKMKGFNPGKGTGMGSAFHKNGDPPPQSNKNTELSNYEIYKYYKNKEHINEGSDFSTGDPYEAQKLRLQNKNQNIVQTHDQPQVVGSSPAFMDWIAGPVGRGIKGIQAASKGANKGRGAIKLFNKIKNFKFGRTKNIKPKVKTLPESKIPHYGDIKTRTMPDGSNVDVDKITNIIKQKGKLWDEAYTANPKNFFTKDMFKEVKGFGGKGPGTKGYRRVVEMSKEGLPTQRMWQSTSLGNKKFADGSGTLDSWLPMEGFGTLHDPTYGIVRNWAVKGKGWDKGYGVKLYDKDFLGHHVNKYLPKKK